MQAEMPWHPQSSRTVLSKGTSIFRLTQVDVYEVMEQALSKGKYIFRLRFPDLYRVMELVLSKGNPSLS